MDTIDSFERCQIPCRHKASTISGIFLFLGLSICLTSNVFGVEAGKMQAAAVVRGWRRNDARPLGEILGSTVKEVQVFTNETGQSVYHVVYLDPTGFVVVAAEDLVEPIVAFSVQGRYDPSPDNPLGDMITHDVPGRVAQARASRTLPTGALLKAQSKWQMLASSDASGIVVQTASSGASDVRVAPFVQSRWNQQTAGNGASCYNYYVPPNASGNSANYPCGCVATAMSQLMRYYQYPAVGVGTASFTITVNGSVQSASLLGGDGAGGAYSWSDMVLVPSSPTTLQCQAIGALTHDAGVSVNMAYASGGSSASLTTAKNQLINTFKYGGGIDGYNYNRSRGTFDNIGGGLTNMLNPNMDARMPVLLGINGAAGGHAVVCDGYGFSVSTLYHHVNLGWGGTADAWYALPLVDTGYYTFTNFNECVYNVYTNGSGEIISGRILDAGGVPISGATVTAKKGGVIVRTASTDTNGIYAVTQLSSQSGYTLYATKGGYATNSGTFSTGTSANNSATSGNYWGANFYLTNLPVALVVLASATNGGTVSGGGLFLPGTQQPIAAEANAGWDFINWQDGSTQNVRSVTVPASGATFTATFLARPTFAASVWTPSGLSVTLQGMSGTNQIQASTNLIDWITVAVITNQGSSVSYTDYYSTNYPQRFYRCVRGQ